MQVREVFPGVDLAGGACYFLWDRDHKHENCIVTNIHGDESLTIERPLDEYENVFIRSNKAIGIVHNVTRNKTSFLSERISARLPYGITTTYEPVSEGIPCYFTQKLGLQFVKKEDVKDESNNLNTWRFLIPKAPIAGQTDFSKPVGFYYDGNCRIAKPGECCSESWLVAGSFGSKQETEFYKSFIFTKVVRFLLLQTVVSQNITRRNFCFIPDLGVYDRHYTDEYLCKLWEISEDEWEYIDSRIHNYESTYGNEE